MSMTNEEIDKLTDEQKNARIAEACGRYDFGAIAPERGSLQPRLIGRNKERMDRRPIPDYCRDLNAMHEAEKVILDPVSPTVWANHEERGEIKRAYQAHLERLATLGGTSAICATARQRATAFLLTV